MTTRGKQAEWSSMFQLNTIKSEEEGETTNKEVVTPTGSETPGENPEEVVIESKEVVIEERDGDEEEEEEITDTTITPVVEKKEVKKEEVIDTTVGAFASVIPLLNKGVLIYDESKEYENSDEGIAELVADNNQAVIEAFKNQYPKEALEVLEHLKNGGSLNELIQLDQEGPDYENDVDLTDEDHQRYLISDFLAEQGLSDDKIKAKLAKYEEAGLLEDEAKSAHEELIKLQKSRKVQVIENQKKIALERENDLKTRTDAFKKKVTEIKEIAGFQLKPGEQQILLDYMTKPVKEGKTKMQIEYDEDTQLKMAYFMMKKFDFKEVEKKAITKATIKLKEVVNRVTDTNLNTKGVVVPKEEKEDESSDVIHGLPWFNKKSK